MSYNTSKADIISPEAQHKTIKLYNAYEYYLKTWHSTENKNR